MVVLWFIIFSVLPPQWTAMEFHLATHNVLGRNHLYFPHSDEPSPGGETAYLNHQSVHSKNPYNTVPGADRKTTGRALAEALLVTAVSTAHYWARYGLWAEDWQYQFNWRDQKKRWLTLEAQRLDSNSFMTNAIHVLQGAVFYNIGRSNRLSIGESFLFSLGSSLIWEYLVEYKEIVAINDNVFTTFGGVATGEPLYHLGNFLYLQPGTIPKIFSAIVNPILFINRWLDKKTNIPPPSQKHPYTLKSHLNLRQVYGTGWQTNGWFSRFHFGINARLYLLPQSETSGKQLTKIKSTLMSGIDFKLELGEQEIEEFSLHTRVAYWGIHLRDKKITAIGVKGYHWFLSAGSSFEMIRKKSTAIYDTISSGSSTNEQFDIVSPTEFSDKIAVMNIIGPLAEIDILAPRFRWCLGLEAFLNFSQVNAFALAVYSQTHPIGGLKSTLKKYGYYYALGLTLGIKSSISFRRLEVSGWMRYHGFSSIEGLDRFQEYVTDDIHLRDRRFASGFSLGYRFLDSPVTLILSHERIIRVGSMGRISLRGEENRITAGFRIGLD